MARLSIVIPCLNEARRLPPSLLRIGEYLEAKSRWHPVQIIVVDDGSSDNTVDAARSVPLSDNIELVTVEHGHNRGKGAAVRSGFGASSGASVLLSDADLATPVEELEVLRRASSNTRVAFGSRALDRSLIETRQPLYRDLMGRTFNLAVRFLLLPGVRDTQCGFKLFPGPLARALAGAQRMDGFAYDVELLVLARSWGHQIVEVPVRWRHVDESRVRAIHHSSNMLLDVIMLWIRRVSGRLAQAPSGFGEAK